MQEDASQQVDLETATAMMEQAFATWQAVRCPPSGEPPSIRVRRVGTVTCARPEFNAFSSNANAVLFFDDKWPYPGAENALGKTTVTFDKDTGEIQDADIAINATNTLSVEFPLIQKALAIGGDDLLSIMTHEAGHFLGLDHSADATAVMKPMIWSGEVITTLSPDDEAAICAAYPPGRLAEPCDTGSKPAGFSAQCYLDPESGGACSAAPGRRSSAATALGFCALALGVFARRNRQRRR